MENYAGKRQYTVEENFSIEGQAELINGALVIQSMNTTGYHQDCSSDSKL